VPADHGERRPGDARARVPVRERREGEDERRDLEERARERTLASLRFWLVLTAVIATSIALAIVIWNQIQQLFGL
jgi:hypothetical protein